MLERQQCSDTGSIIDWDPIQAGHPSWFISCGDCSWNHQLDGGGFTDAEQELTDHYAHEIDHPDPSFFWAEPDHTQLPPPNPDRFKATA